MKAIKNKLNQKGFSLIELMVVIVIMLILAAIAIPAFLGVIDDSKVSAATSEVRSVLMLAQLEVNKDVDILLPDVKTAILTEAGVNDDAASYTFRVETETTAGGNQVKTAVIDYDNGSVEITLPEQFASTSP